MADIISIHCCNGLPVSHHYSPVERCRNSKVRKIFFILNPRISDVTRIKNLEKENAERKKRYAEMSLEIRAMKGLIEKSSDAQEKWEAIEHLKIHKQPSNRKACKLVGIPLTKLEEWCRHDSRQISLQFIQPGRLMQKCLYRTKERTKMHAGI